MLRSAIFISSVIAFGISGVVAVAGQISPATEMGATLSTGADSNPWSANEVRSLFEPAKKFMMVDVNDKFLVKTTYEGEEAQFGLAILDGARETIGSCANASKLKDGEPRTTWLKVRYSKPNASGIRSFSLHRTLDFSRHDRVYRFSANSDNTYQILEPGISVRLDRNVLTYEQTTGPIGASGKTKALRLTYTLSDRLGDISSSVEMDRALWKVSSTKSVSSIAPRLTINNVAVDPFVAGTQIDAEGEYSTG